MDNLNVFGAIASIISLFITLGFIFWGVIKKSKISGFNLYVLVVVLIHAILAGYWLWNDENVRAVITGTILMFIILLWLLQYLSKRLLDFIDFHDEMNQGLDERDQETQKILQLFTDTVDIIEEIVIKMEQEDERLSDEIKTLQKKMREVDIDRQEKTGDWREQFADGFVSHLEGRRSPLMDSEVFMGKRARGYPVYIGFNIGKIENLDMQDRNAFWLAASTAHSKKIYLKLHMNDSNCFRQLKSQKAEIERKFGDQLKWESHGRDRYLRIGVDLEVDPLDENKGQWNQHFKEMRENLEKLGKTLLPYIEEISSEDDLPF